MPPMIGPAPASCARSRASACRSWHLLRSSLGKRGARTVPHAGGTVRVVASGLSHVVVGGILADVADIENDGFLAEVLPPVRGAVDLGPDVARLVHDRIDAVAGVFHDLALLDEDQRRPVVVAVPRHDAAGLDGELAETQLAAFDVRGLLAEIDGAERRVGDADRLVVDHLAGIGLLLAGGTFAGD